MTPKLFTKFINAYEKRLNQQLNLADTANHVLGMYIKSAVSDILSGKNRYYDEPLIAKAQAKAKQGEMTAQQMVRMAERNSAILNGVSKLKASRKKE